ncbi:MAG: GIY-YIG nuclease family protein [Steroidobacteraceae bacterium]
MPYVYILECNDGTFYTGSTWDMERRLWQHQNGLGANYTSDRLPVKLAFCETSDRIEDAFRREKQIQGWSHSKKLVLINSNLEQLRKLSRHKNSDGS